MRIFGPGKYTLHFRIHVEVRHHAGLRPLKQVGKLRHRGLIWSQVLRLSLGVASFRHERIFRDHQRWKGLSLLHQLGVHALLHALEDREEAEAVVGRRAARKARSQSQLLDERLVDGDEFLGGVLVGQVLAEERAEAARDGAVAVAAEAQEGGTHMRVRIRIRFHIHPDSRRAAGNARCVGQRRGGQGEGPRSPRLRFPDLDEVLQKRRALQRHLRAVAAEKVRAHRRQVLRRRKLRKRRLPRPAAIIALLLLPVSKIRLRLLDRLLLLVEDGSDVARRRTRRVPGPHGHLPASPPPPPASHLLVLTQV
mmetsp:Transcript_14401/g.36347  ORF Transcript_14401/g.36347 Transcript_14401/m.36347 type:complete len:309 (-) Transcript_14401:46-972(-)